MHTSGTFDYIAVVPDTANDGLFECRAESRKPASDRRLVGLAPTLAVAEAGLTPDTSSGQPWVMRARVTLTASSRTEAAIADASFHIDRALARRMQPGDVIHLTRTTCASLALSIVRDGELVAAVGAVTAVPLGHHVTAHTPQDLVEDAAAVFRRRDFEFDFGTLPVEVVVTGRSVILGHGGRALGGYEIVVIHGWRNGIPGSHECAAIWRADLCTYVAAHASMTLMASRAGAESLAMSSW